MNHEEWEAQYEKIKALETENARLMAENAKIADVSERRRVRLGEMMGYRDHEHQNAEFWRDQLRQVEAALLKAAPERSAGVDLVTWAEQIAASINRLHESRCEAMNELNQRNHELDDDRAAQAYNYDLYLRTVRMLDAARACARLWKEAAKVDIPDRITGQDDYDFYAAKLNESLPRAVGVQAEFGQDGER